jgi:uncharacterized FAD-dependent dehydrogenase
VNAELQISVLPEEAANIHKLKIVVASKIGVSQNEINHLEVLRRSIDARGREVKFVLKIKVIYNEIDFVNTSKPIHYSFKQAFKNPVIIVGAGPAGYFAALKLLERGIKPIIIERGKAVKERRRDLAAITKEHLVNSNSNYCFGEGGAGTYSDGKLYTRSTKRGDVKRILELLVQHGANENILIDAHPHIGTNKLPQIITAIRNTLENHGGEVHFNEKVFDFIIKEDKVLGVKTENTITQQISEFRGDSVILATGHSSRDIFEWFNNNQYLIEAKPFAMGVRIEHPQGLIDEIQYHKKERGPLLPPASYSLVTQALNKGVYSFCMCPGGIIAPCATAPGEIVTNGWSPSKRDNPFANSGLVVEVKPEDYQKYSNDGPLAGLRLQQEFEKTAFESGGKTQVAPAQRMVDFINNRISDNLPECSYIPGVISTPLNILMPKEFTRPMQEALKMFGKNMKGYLTNEAILVGFETRTSSPTRIPREKESLNHPQLTNLYPCGEGAGYAGGIISAAIDGEKCAEAILSKLI